MHASQSLAFAHQAQNKIDELTAMNDILRQQLSGSQQSPSFLEQENIRLIALLNAEKLAVSALKEKLGTVESVAVHEQQLHDLNQKIDELRRKY